jgi:hypothetical protein
MTNQCFIFFKESFRINYLLKNYPKFYTKSLTENTAGETTHETLTYLSGISPQSKLNNIVKERH